MRNKSLATILLTGVLRWFLAALTTGLVTSLVLGTLVWVLTAGAYAVEMSDGVVWPNAVTKGTRLFASSTRRTTAPMVFTDIRINVTGIMARVRVQQRFRNVGARWAEGIYVFPLPEDAAVDSLSLRIGARRIEGVLKERRMAQRTYRQARQEGRQASLLEQERPNLFTASVANIGPKETVDVEIRYQQTVRYDQGR